MAHWIDKKQKTRISDADYNILSKGMKKTIGAEGNTFGLSSKDYVEMNIPEEKRLLYMGIMFGSNYTAHQVNETFDLTYKTRKK